MIGESMGLVCVKFGNKTPTILVDPTPPGGKISMTAPCDCSENSPITKVKCSQTEVEQYEKLVKGMEKPFGVTFCCVGAHPKAIIAGKQGATLAEEAGKL